MRRRRCGHRSLYYDVASSCYDGPKNNKSRRGRVLRRTLERDAGQWQRRLRPEDHP